MATDLTAVKSLVYADKPQTLDHLEDNIRRIIANIRPQMLEKSSKIGRPDWTTSELNAIAFCSDIKQTFLQICLANKHNDAVRFLWSDDEPRVHKKPNLQVYHFNRVNFGVSSSPFLLAATIRHHIEKYKHEVADTVELLDKSFYVDNLIFRW
ncbi:uncharacterized protein TNCV_4543251 [Trichonephila clavipes]|nr:uncharacterized protein TNCV_4543251 [Trichonephila clavipes]